MCALYPIPWSCCCAGAGALRRSQFEVFPCFGSIVLDDSGLNGSMVTLYPYSRSIHCLPSTRMPFLINDLDPWLEAHHGVPAPAGIRQPLRAIDLRDWKACRRV